jgi:hypothetical protein
VNDNTLTKRGASRKEIENMGYTTDFEGQVDISPPLNAEEREFLTKFSDTRRMNRQKGPYFVDATGFAGQDPMPDILNYNSPPEGQPGLWCQWTPTEDGSALEWDGGEKFYESAEWMRYLIDHFLKPGAIAKSHLPFLQTNHTVNGVIRAQGEDADDRWELVVENNRVTTRALASSY